MVVRLRVLLLVVRADPAGLTVVRLLGEPVLVVVERLAPERLAPERLAPERLAATRVVRALVVLVLVVFARGMSTFF
jgi:hypothetical protein